jgi:hypothetical protein
MLRKLCSGKLVLIVFLPLFFIVVMAFTTMAESKRGKEPQCQEECLATHSAKMKLLSLEYTNTGDKMKYQDAVEDEASRYFRCLTNCREPMSIK